MFAIAGILNIDGEVLGSSTVAQQMAASIAHRGPDDEGMLADGPVAFGFRRLRIIDLETGHQPVTDEQEQRWCMFNGEIYNFVELRERLEAKGYSFRTNSDTEVILHAYAEYDLDFVQHLRGMFAIALWDATRQRLVLVRDRVGKKPLFYGVCNRQLAFASEVKAFLKWPEFRRTIDGRSMQSNADYSAYDGREVFVVLARKAAEIGIELSVSGVDGQGEIVAAALVLSFPDPADLYGLAARAFGEEMIGRRFGVITAEGLSSNVDVVRHRSDVPFQGFPVLGKLNVIRWSSASVCINVARFRPSQQKSAQVRFRSVV